MYNDCKQRASGVRPYWLYIQDRVFTQLPAPTVYNRLQTIAGVKNRLSNGEVKAKKKCGGGGGGGQEVTIPDR